MCKLRIFVVLLLPLSSYGKEHYNFVYIDNSTEQSIGKLVIEEVYRQLDISVSIDTAPPKRSEHALSSGVADGEIMRIYSYGNHNPNVIRVPTPYYYVETTAFVRTDSNIQLSELDDLKHYRVSRVRGIKHTEIISRDVQNVVELSTSHQLISFVNLGRGDIALTSRLDGLATILSKGFSNVTDVKEPLAVWPVYHYLYKDHLELAQQVDEKIRELAATGELKTIIHNAENVVLTEGITRGYIEDEQMD